MDDESGDDVILLCYCACFITHRRQKNDFFIIRLYVALTLSWQSFANCICMRPRDCFQSIMFFPGQTGNIDIMRVVWAHSASVFWFWFYCFPFNFSSVVVYIFNFTAVFLVFVLPSGVIENDKLKWPPKEERKKSRFLDPEYVWSKASMTLLPSPGYYRGRLLFCGTSRYVLWVCPCVCPCVRLPKWSDLFEVKTKMFQFWGRVCLLCLALQNFLLPAIR